MAKVQDIVSKVWKLCDVLRDDGVTFHQYVNELTYLLFLKMAQETGTERQLLDGCRWGDLASRSKDPAEQYRYYLHMLDDLGTRAVGPVRDIFANPTTSLHHAESLNKLVTEISAIDWHSMGREGLGDVYEGILQKNASEKKGGAGQYFTPRPLVDSIVSVLRPVHGEVIVDPAAGTAGFFVSANAYLNAKTASDRGRKRSTQFVGIELVRDTHRLALMNCTLHGIEGEMILGDSLALDGARIPQANLILTNPPFGSKRGAGRAMRDDLPFPTANKQLAFLQLIYLSLVAGGRAGVILPDSVLTEDGIAAKVREDLLDKCNLHTILRLPTGIFYAQGVRTNVLFFTRGRSQKDNTKDIWVYDLRTEMPSFGKRTPLTREHFAGFEKAYGEASDGSSPRLDEGESGRFRRFSAAQIRERRGSLDLSWLKPSRDGWNDDGDIIEVAAQVRERVQLALDELDLLMLAVEGDEGTE